MRLFLIMLFLPVVLQATTWSEHAASLDQWLASKPVLERARVDKPLELIPGELVWERGLLRRSWLPFFGDSLLMIEAYGRGRWQISGDTQEEVSRLASYAGRKGFDEKPRRMILLLPATEEIRDLPEFKAPGRITLDFLRRDLDQRHPALAVREDGPALLFAQHLAATGYSKGFLWCLNPANETLHFRAAGQEALTAALHGGSRVRVPWLRRTRPAVSSSSSHPGTPEAAFRILNPQLDLAPQEAGLIPWNYQAELLPQPGLDFVWLKLDQSVEVEAAVGVDHKGSLLLIDCDTKNGNCTVSFKGSTAIKQVIERDGELDLPSQKALFPAEPWWHPATSLSLSVEGMSPLQLKGLESRRWTNRYLRSLLDQLEVRRTLASERMWLDSEFAINERRNQALLEQRQLNRQKEYVDAGGEMPAVDSGAHGGMDSWLSRSVGENSDSLMLANRRAFSTREELEAAAALLEGWLGPQEAPRIEAVKSRRALDDLHKRRMADSDLAEALPACITLPDWTSTSDHAALRRLEALCHTRLEQVELRAAIMPDWIAAGWSRSVALLLMDDLRGSDVSRRLRAEAINKLNSAFRPHQARSSLAAGSSAEGSWRNQDVNDQLAWRFALVLENLRWQLMDPETISCETWPDLLARVAEEIRSPRDWRRPEHSLTGCILGFVKDNQLMDEDRSSELASWLAGEWERTIFPEINLKLVGSDSGMTLVECSSDGAGQGVVLPLLIDNGQRMQLLLLRITDQPSWFPLDLPSKDIRAWRVDPGASLLARIRE